MEERIYVFELRVWLDELNGCILNNKFWIEMATENVEDVRFQEILELEGIGLEEFYQ